MPDLYSLLVIYGVCFGLMNKVEWLRRSHFLNRMLECAYCTGFHSGWMVWVFVRVTQGGPYHISEVVLWAFCGSAFCYFMDNLVLFFEALPKLVLTSERALNAMRKG